MPGLQLLQLSFNAKENCRIQTVNLDGAVITGGVYSTDAHSGENFCGNAGDTTGHSRFSTYTSSSARSSANSSSTSGGGTSAGQNAKKAALAKEHRSSGSTKQAAQGAHAVISAKIPAKTTAPSTHPESIYQILHPGSSIIILI